MGDVSRGVPIRCARRHVPRMGWIATLIGAAALAYASRLAGLNRMLVGIPGLVALVFGLLVLTGLISA